MGKGREGEGLSGGSKWRTTGTALGSWTKLDNKLMKHYKQVIENGYIGTKNDHDPTTTSIIKITICNILLHCRLIKRYQSNILQ